MIREIKTLNDLGVKDSGGEENHGMMKVETKEQFTMQTPDKSRVLEGVGSMRVNLDD